MKISFLMTKTSRKSWQNTVTKHSNSYFQSKTKLWLSKFTTIHSNLKNTFPMKNCTKECIYHTCQVHDALFYMNTTAEFKKIFYSTFRQIFFRLFHFYCTSIWLTVHVCWKIIKNNNLLLCEWNWKSKKYKEWVENGFFQYEKIFILCWMLRREKIGRKLISLINNKNIFCYHDFAIKNNSNRSRTVDKLIARHRKVQFLLKIKLKLDKRQYLPTKQQQNCFQLLLNNNFWIKNGIFCLNYIWLIFYTFHLFGITVNIRNVSASFLTIPISLSIWFINHSYTIFVYIKW